MKVRFFNPGLEFTKNQKMYVDEYIRVRSAGDLILRSDVSRFEGGMSRYLGVKYAVALNSGTDALLIALKSIGIESGDRVLVPSHTFVATPQVVNQLGATPVLYDLDEVVKSTYNFKAIMPAHISGKLDLNMLNENTIVIEDSCQALGAMYDGKKAGTFGLIGCFSFYPAKLLGAPGDAGMLVTNDKATYEFAMEYRNHFKGTNEEWGINSRLDNVWAAELNLKLDNIDYLLNRRKEIAMTYLKGLTSKVDCPPNQSGRVWQDFIIGTEKRDQLFDYLKDEGIETLKNEYPFPIPKLPKSIKYESESLRLPIDPGLTKKEIDYIIKKVNKFYV